MALDREIARTLLSQLRFNQKQIEPLLDSFQEWMSQEGPPASFKKTKGRDGKEFGEYGRLQISESELARLVGHAATREDADVADSIVAAAYFVACAYLSRQQPFAGVSFFRSAQCLGDAGVRAWTSGVPTNDDVVAHRREVCRLFAMNQEARRKKST